MPIQCDIQVEDIGQERFNAVDKAVMRYAFDIHNTLGRFCDERIYQEALAQRCLASGLNAVRELPLRVVHHGFTKPYFVDLLVDRGVIYELKAVEALNRNHE